LSRGAWLFGPLWDLLFVASLYWPIVVAITATQLWVEHPLTFLQVYFISSPHRWATLLLVFLDHERMAGERARFLTVGAGLLLLGLAIVGFSALVPGLEHVLIPLMMLDYVWNSWHFSAQHAGMGRIYARAARLFHSPQMAELEKASVRLLVLWSFFRLALVIAANQVSDPTTIRTLSSGLAWLDPLAALPALTVFGYSLIHLRDEGISRVAYLGSVVTLYSCMLVAFTLGNDALIRGFLLASALFHAGEYLMVCLWAVNKKKTGVWSHPATHGLGAFFGFIALVGLANWLLFLWSQYLWMFITLLVSLLHYGYDGMIWKARPSTPSLAKPS
jgi:hypothetical protein